MRRVSRLLPCALALVLAVGCQDDAPLSSDPDAVELAGKGTCPAAELIDDLFPKGLANAATQQCKNIQRQFARGHKDNAFNKMENLVAFIQHHLENGRLDDPDGSGPETDASGAAALIVQLHAIVGLADGSEAIPSEAFTAEGGTVQTLDAQETWDVETRDGFAGITKAAGVPVFLNGQPYEGPVTLFIAPIEPSASGFPGFGLQVGGSDRAAFPLFKDIGTIPTGITFGDGNIGETANSGNELVVEICIVDPPHPLAPLPGQLPDLRIGHIHEGQVQVAPLRSSTLDCSGVNDEVPTVAWLENRWHRWANVAFAPFASLFDVRDLLANPGRLGGAISAFSEFGGVDRTELLGDVVLPEIAENKMLRWENRFPHSTPNMRYQQIFLASEVGSGNTFVGLCLRPDDVASPDASVQQEITLKLGPTNHDLQSISLDFDGNYSAPSTTVFSGQFDMPAAPPGDVDDWVACMDFDIPYDHPGGALIVEMINSSSSAPTTFWFADACTSTFAPDEEPNCNTTRVYAHDATASLATVKNISGLAIRLLVAP